MGSAITTNAFGASPAVAWGTAITAASATLGWVSNTPSNSIEAVDAIPKSPTGKILRRVLKDRESTDERS